MLKAQGDVLAFLKQTDEALTRYEEALRLYRAVGARLGEANVLKAQGDAALRGGQIETGMALLEQAQQLYHRIGDREGLSDVGICPGTLCGLSTRLGPRHRSDAAGRRLLRRDRPSPRRAAPGGDRRVAQSAPGIGGGRAGFAEWKDRRLLRRRPDRQPALCAPPLSHYRTTVLHYRTTALSHFRSPSDPPIPQILLSLRLRSAPISTGKTEMGAGTHAGQ